MTQLPITLASMTPYVKHADFAVIDTSMEWSIDAKIVINIRKRGWSHLSVR